MTKYIYKQGFIFLVAFVSFCGANGYTYTIYNTTNSNVTLTFNLQEKSDADYVVQNEWWSVINPVGETAVGLAAYCDFTFPKEITVNANAVGILNTSNTKN